MISHRGLPLTISDNSCFRTDSQMQRGNSVRPTYMHSTIPPCRPLRIFIERLVRERTSGKHGIYILEQADRDSESFTIAQNANGTLDMGAFNLTAFNNLVPSS